MKKLVLLVLVMSLGLSLVHCGSCDYSTNDNSKEIKFSVVIDASHGGKDTGALSKSGSISEKDISLDISKRIVSELSKKDIKAYLSRKDDRFLSLEDRINFFEKSGANLVISIHTNTSNDNSKNGYTTFYQVNNDGSLRLSKCIHKELNLETILQDNGIKTTKAYLLKNSKIPTVLLELGYISNDNDFYNLVDEVNQDTFAKHIATAVEKYIR